MNTASKPSSSTKLVQQDGPADDHIGQDFDAHLLQRIDLPLHQRLGQLELGDAVHEHAAGRVQRLKMVMT